MSSDLHDGGHGAMDAHSGHIHPAPTSFFRRYVWSTDHKVIGKQYLWTSLVFLLIGGLLAMLIRWQLMNPGKPVPVLGDIFKNSLFFTATGAVDDRGYIQLVTMHGTIMIFAVVIPILVGAFGNFLIPLHVGARDVAFPIVNALSYWFFWPGATLLFISFFVPVAEGGAAIAGWTSYPPLSDLQTATTSQGWGQNLWLMGLILIGTSSILAGLNFLTTIIAMRAPGMTWGKLPLTTWAQFITSVLQLLATPVLASALFMLLIDRLTGAGFFLPKALALGGGPAVAQAGGEVLMWQHIFWFYSHPAVYILVLPAMGIASDLLSAGARKPIFGYKAMVLSMASIAGLGFIVWGHHMFQSGMNPMVGFAFMVSTMMIALPSSIKVFNWLGTLWRGNIRFTVPMCNAIAFVSMFIIGGLSGIFMAATPVDIFIHDTYIIVAHFHYVVFGGTLFAVFGGLQFWYPKMFGRMMNKGLGYIHFFLTFIFFNLVFWPMHHLGIAGHMRRIGNPSNYMFLQHLAGTNRFISICAFCLGASQLIFLGNFFFSMWKGKKAEGNPWESNTLEWTIPSPPPFHNYDTIPTVQHGPYEYNIPGGPPDKDWNPQNAPSAGAGAHH